MPETETVKIALVQMPCSKEREENCRKAFEQVQKAADKGAEIVCLQELFSGQYFCQKEEFSPFDDAEAIPGPLTDRLSSLAAETGVVLIASVFEQRRRGLYHNTTVVFETDGRLLGKYRKMHIPDDPGYYEKFYFTPGDLGYVVFETSVASVGVLVCWDQWFPEAARILALKGAQIIFCPTAIGWALGDPSETSRRAEENRREQLAAWIDIQRSHAIANGVFIAAVNRVGTEGSIEFWGNSFVCNPIGRITAAADASPATLLDDCDLGQIDYYRQRWPLLRDRRIETYAEIMQRCID